MDISVRLKVIGFIPFSFGGEFWQFGIYEIILEGTIPIPL